MFRIIRSLLISGNIRGLLDASRRAVRQVGIERIVAQGRRELRGGEYRYGELRPTRYGRTTEESPFSYNLEQIKMEEEAANRANFWGRDDIWTSEQEKLHQKFLKDEWFKSLSGDQQWNNFINESLPWENARNRGYYMRNYNPLSDPPIRAGGNFGTPPFWRHSGNPISADGINILPWQNYEYKHPIEMTKYADPFFNSPTFNPEPIIDINRNRKW